MLRGNSRRLLWEKRTVYEHSESCHPPIKTVMASSERATPAVRRRLPDERHSLTHHFSVGGQEGYVTIGLYEDGLPGEMFIRMSKEGSTVSGLMDSFATAVSLALQYGVPLQVLCNKFSHTRFEPSGWSGNPKIGYAKSLMDYLFRWLELRFLKGEQGILFELPKVVPLRPEPGSTVKSLGADRQHGRCASVSILRRNHGQKRILLSMS